MRETFSDAYRFRLWRKLWYVLADCERLLGLQISAEQVESLREAAEERFPLPLDAAAAYEAKLRHDVMAHVHALGDQVPIARPIIHLGATSCYVTDNAELLQQKRGLELLERTLWLCIQELAQFAAQYRDLPTLAYTHFQPAQPTTVGKRACLWIQDLLIDGQQLERIQKELKFRGVKGTTGTQASFLALFDGDHQRVRQLDRLVTERMGFAESFPITGQTYPRKQDFLVLAVLAGMGQSAAKMANDIRLLQHMKEIEEPYETNQIGSSAMAYKRNPMRSERINGLARFLQTLALNPAETASTQWLERTLDDSANRRLAISEAFLTADAILQLVLNISRGLVVHPRVIESHLLEELPFMATENILMAAVRAGQDRQTIHEAIRQHSLAAAARVKDEGLSNDLLERIKADERFACIRDQLDSFCNGSEFIGRAPQQVDEFLSEQVYPALESYRRRHPSSVAADTTPDAAGVIRV
jgi:adenylosuccinate lyase